ncbi:MAG: M56 family metallopeptidase [Bacteroidales bacterium]|jgi:beta-lactamase regulating signal transducer with metallopeptidase domain|nr:M56 family metallopeptidase [Bacteroidales bacterium]
MIPISEGLLSGSLARALSCTIVNSLWQGALLSLLVIVLLIAIPRNRASLRYIVSATFLLLMLAIPVITMTIIYDDLHADSSYQSTLSNVLHFDNRDADYLSGIGATGKFNEGISRLASFISGLPHRYSTTISLLWIAGILVLTLRFAGNLWFLRRLKASGSQKEDSMWTESFKVLCSMMTIKRCVRLLESAMAKTPMVIGYIKPVILVPAGMLAGLPADQVETILLHELAHIRRNDFIINIVQSLIDILLFFNPFARHISAVVREERENACDDIAVAVSARPGAYAMALLNIYDRNFGQTAMAMTIAGSNNMINRIKRIATMKRQKTTIPGGRLTAMLMTVSLALMLILFSGAGEPSAVRNPEPVTGIDAVTLPPAYEASSPGTSPRSFGESFPAMQRQDTIIKKHDRIYITKVTDPADGKSKSVEIRYKGSTRTEIIIDGKTIPPSEYPKYDELIMEAESRIEASEEERDSLRQDILEDYRISIEQLRKDLRTVDVERGLMQAEVSVRRAEEFLTQEVLRDMEKDMKEAQAQIEKMINSEEFRKSIEEAHRQYRDQMDQIMGSEEFRKQIEEARKEYQKQMDEILRNDTLRRKIEDIHKEYQKQMEEIRNSDEYRKAMEEVRRETERIRIIADSVRTRVIIRADAIHPLPSGQVIIIRDDDTIDTVSSVARNQKLEQKLEEVEKKAGKKGK